MPTAKSLQPKTKGHKPFIPVPGIDSSWDFTTIEDQLENNKHGQPQGYKNPEDLIKRGFEYFSWCVKNKHVPTLTGMALFVGTSRTTLWSYKSRDLRWLNTVKRLKDMVAYFLEQRGFLEYKPTMEIFSLKSNHSHFDKPEFQQQVQVNVQLNIEREYTEAMEAANSIRKVHKIPQ